MSTVHEIQRSWSHEIGGPTMTVSPVAEPYEWLAIDIETANGRPEDAERELRMKWKPAASWKDETVGARYRAAQEKAQERRALCDSSPIVIVSIRTPSELRVLHHLEARDPETVEGALVEGFADERAMLLALRSLLEARCDESTLIVGHNVKSFDLPKLRQSYLRHGLRLPSPLAAHDQGVYDTMREYARRFSLADSLYIALADILELLQLPGYKSLIDGAMVPELVEAGEIDALVRYALLDAVAESELYLRMTGQSPDAKGGAS